MTTTKSGLGTKKISAAQPLAASATIPAFALVGLVFVAIFAIRSYAAVIVVPGDLSSTEGSSGNGLPFDIAQFDLTSERHQQFYPASAFSALAGPMYITKIAFRPDRDYGSVFSSTLPDVQVNLSTTSFDPAALSATFENNVGVDDTVVFGRGPLALSSSFSGPDAGPKDFDIVINLSTPFLYDPTRGSLLLDVRNFGGGYTTPLDSELFSDASRVYTYEGQSVNSISGTVDTVALATQFTFTPVPEPSMLALFGLSVLALVCGCRHAMG